MKIFKPVFYLILPVITICINGQTVAIKGSGSGFNNTELRFFSQTDPITKRLKPLLRTRCDEKGAFSVVLPCKKSQIIFINAGTFKFRLYVSGGSSYDLLFPNFVPKTGIEDQNPFFRETELMPEVVSNKQDLNNLIKDFDSEFDPVFNFVADRVFRNFKNEALQKEISKLDKFPVDTADQFYVNYVGCRKLMLHLVVSPSVAEKQKALDCLNSGFDSGNQAFADLAEQMFSGYFSNFLIGPLKDSFSRAIATASLSELKTVILRDGKIVNKELTDFVMLLNLYGAYYDRLLPEENVRKILTLLRSQGQSDFTKNIAFLILEKINSSLSGNPLPDFSLANGEGKLISLKDLKGKYLLLGFARSDNQPSLMELGIINMWQKKYMDDIQVVTILTDNDFSAGLDRMKKNGFNWIFLNGSDKDNLEFTYDIKMYPSFILLDRNGKIIANPCSYPSEELELKINKIITTNNGSLPSQDK